MNIKQLKQFLPYAFKVNASVIVHGLHGIGKSQVIKQFAQENGMEFIDRRLSQIESGDLLGLPDVSGEVTKYKLPSWLPTDPKSRGILFLDEINRARRDVLQGVFQLVLDRQLGDYTLPKGWAVVSAINPNTDDYDVTNVFDEALMDRFLHIKLNPTAEEFLSFARKQKNVEMSFLDYLQINEEKLENSKLNTFTLDRKPSRRSNMKAAELLATGLPEDLIVEGVGGLIGITNVVAYMTWLKENDVKPFSGEEVVTSYDKIAEKAAKYADAVTGRHDILDASFTNTLQYIQDNYKKMKPDGYANVLKLVKAAPKDLSQAFLKRLIDVSSPDQQMLTEYIIPNLIDVGDTDFLLTEEDEKFLLSLETEESK